VQSKMGSGKMLAYLLPIVQCLASFTNNGWRPSPGEGNGAAGADRKSGRGVVRPLMPHARISNAEAIVYQPTVPIFVHRDCPRGPLGGGEAQV
jgi:hypothetical protein